MPALATGRGWINVRYQEINRLRSDMARSLKMDPNQTWNLISPETGSCCHFATR
jgi:hypothetical protein